MIEIYIPTKADKDMVEAFARLLPQLANHLTSPDIEELQSLIDSQGTTLYIAKHKEKIVGALSLVTYQIPTGTKGWIEDVIVDSEARGLGIAYKLLQFAIEKAKELGITKLNLTSGHHREAAHKLYYKCGFEKRDTGVFRLTL